MMMPAESFPDASRREFVDTGDSFVALVIYPSTAAAQVGQADTLVRMTDATLRSMPGVGGRIFLSEDGEHVVTLVEWRDRESFGEFRRSEFGRAATHVVGELHPKAYWLRPHATVEA
jgi:heme-degrading monooxygenase HmoA